MSELVGALPWPFYELDRWAVKWDQVISPSDTSQCCMGELYRTLRRDGGLSGGVDELTDGVWTLSGRTYELTDGPVVLADRPSSQ